MTRYEMRLTVSSVRRFPEPRGARLKALRFSRSRLGLAVHLLVIAGGIVASFVTPVGALAAAMAALTLGLSHGPGPESTIGDKNIELERLAEFAESAEAERVSDAVQPLEEGVFRKWHSARGMIAISETKRH